jgi:hypothetical protein
MGSTEKFLTDRSRKFAEVTVHSAVTFVAAFAMVFPVSVISARALPQSIRAQVGTVGVNAAATNAYENHETWAALLTGIRAGDREWFDVGRLLYPSAGAALNEDLADAFMAMLDTSPATILASPPLPLLRLCSGEDIDGDPNATTVQQRQRVDRRIRRVASVKLASVSSAQDTCVKALRTFKATLK